MEQKSSLAASAYQMLASIYSSTVQKLRDDPSKRLENLARYAGLRTTKGTTGLLLVRGTDSSAATRRLKTSSTSSVVQWAHS
jgi:hypothetical protein